MKRNNSKLIFTSINIMLFSDSFTLNLGVRMSAEVRWGPEILPGGQWFLFGGKRRPVPLNVQDRHKFLE